MESTTPRNTSGVGQEEIQVVERFLSALSDTDVGAALAFLAEDVCFKLATPLLIEQFGPNRVFAEVFISTQPSPHSTTSLGIAAVYTIRNGLIEALEIFNDAEEAARRVRRSLDEDRSSTR